MQNLNHIDLFSGIGGFALAARWCGLTTVAFCEIEEFPQRVLAKNFPGVPIYDDVRTFPCEKYQRPYLLTGGFPCQPYSVAGKRRGAEDDRALWPAMLEVIKATRPAWVLGENVAGFVSMGLDGCLSDLETAGYETTAFVIPACAVGARHRRDRVWIVANAQGEQDQQRKRGNMDETPCGGEGLNTSFSVGGKIDVHPNGSGREELHPAAVADEPGQRTGELITAGPDWSVESPFCGVAHGIPGRVDRLKGLGNAIVPQVAAEIIRAMRQADKETTHA
jgi:DNA (cytosine-5)-methyltransferase 1